MNPEEAADVFVFFILFGGGISLILIIYNLIKERRHPGSTWLFNHQSTSSLFSGHKHKQFTTVDGPSGSKMHFDENGNYVGRSERSVLGNDIIHFDANGNYAGRSTPGLFSGDMIHTDANGDYAGQSSPGLFGNTIHSGKNGETGVTDKGAFGGKVTDFWDD